MLRALALILLCTAPPAVLPAPAPAQAQTQAETPSAPMSVERLAAILTAIDPDAVIEARGMTLTVAQVPVTVIVDETANRMRILVPVSSAEGLDAEALLRLLQANFDSALDARYAIANGRLWSTFIHPLAELQGDQLISGLAQTVTLAQTYGDTYSSGALVFGGGDTRSLIEDLRNLGEEL